MAITKVQVLEGLKAVTYPGFDMNLVQSKMVESLKVENDEIAFDLILPKSADPNAKVLETQCIQAIRMKFGFDTKVVINKIFRPGFKLPGEDDPMAKIKNIVAIASGKGGVGKSTVSCNLAVALAKQGFKVGLVDADIYGPSLPKMFDVEDEKPFGRKEGNKEWIMPLEKYGVKLLSIGFFIDTQNAAIWRGPMASNMFKQLLQNGDWGELDYLLIDLPPGTSDIHLTLVQTLALTGVVIVTTPQEVAVADAIKGVSMFQSKSINVPVLGIIENMAWFTPEELPNNKYYLFGKDGGKQLAEKLEIPLLAQIPLVQSIRENADNGKLSATNEDSVSGLAFAELAKAVSLQIHKRNLTQPPTKKVEMNS